MNETTTPQTTVTEEPPFDRFATRYAETELNCAKCRSQWTPAVADFVNVKTHPMAKEGILRKTMHHARCPSCKNYFLEIDHIWEYYDPDQQLVLQFRPAWEFRAGGGEEIYWRRLETLVEKYADEDVRVDVVFGFDEMIEKYLGGQEAVAASMERAEQERAEGKEPGSIVMEQATARANAGDQTG